MMASSVVNMPEIRRPAAAWEALRQLLQGHPHGAEPRAGRQVQGLGVRLVTHEPKLDLMVSRHELEDGRCASMKLVVNQNVGAEGVRETLNRNALPGLGGGSRVRHR